MSARKRPAKGRAKKTIGEILKAKREQPVDSEIRRAASRAGIPARDTIPSPPPARSPEELHAMLRNMISLAEREMPIPARRADLLRELGAELERVAEEHDPTTDITKRATEEYYSHLPRLVTGALWVDDEESGINADQALLHLASCQARRF